MSNLQAVKIFGQQLDWSVSTTVLVLILVQVVLIAIALVVFVLLVARRRLSGGGKSILVAEAEKPTEERKPVGITIDALSAPREFRAGDEFLCEGLTVTVNYNAEPYSETTTDFTVDPPDMSAEGKPSVAVRYRDFTSYYTITVLPAAAVREPLGIVLDTGAVRREFAVGDAFSSDGLIVTINYSAEPYAEQTADFTVEPPDMSAEGRPNVVVRHGDFFATYPVEIAARARMLTGIRLDLSAACTEFRAGDAFTDAGLVVYAEYDAEPKEERVFDYTVEAPETLREGECNVAVHYGGFFVTYPVTVTAEERRMTGIRLDLGTAKTDFAIGEEFTSDGLVVSAVYDAEPTEVRVYDYTVEAPALTEAGMFRAVVRYGGFEENYPIFVARGRTLSGITLDDTGVRKEFAPNEEFDCAGLKVTADYDAEPFFERVEDYWVLVPDMTAEGEKEVEVHYGDRTATYRIAVRVPEPAPAETAASEPEEETEVTPEGNSIRYDRSFTARLIQSGDEVKQWYTLIKNELLSYRKVKDRMSWKRETYKASGTVVARFGFRGKALCLFLALDPAEYADTKYKVEDVSVNKSFEDTPCMYRIKNDRRVKRASELIAVIMERLGLEKTDRIAEDYYLPYEGIYELVNEGLAKRIIVSGDGFGGAARTETEAEEVPADEAAAAEAAAETAESDSLESTVEVVGDNLVITEESVEGGTLRYDKSFRAKVIQSDDETKRYYSAIKNELLAYPKVHDRLSWKRETYKASGSVVAKIGYRGSTLCLFLPLDPAEYENTRYKVEDVSANKTFADTPCMFRIRNDKRLRLAVDLIAEVMRERGIDRKEREPVDYAEPYRDIVTLIGEGLVRREIKSKEEESVFGRGE